MSELVTSATRLWPLQRVLGVQTWCFDFARFQYCIHLRKHHDGNTTAMASHQARMTTVRPTQSALAGSSFKVQKWNYIHRLVLGTQSIPVQYCVTKSIQCRKQRSRRPSTRKLAMCEAGAWTLHQNHGEWLRAGPLLIICPCSHATTLAHARHALLCVETQWMLCKQLQPRGIKSSEWVTQIGHTGPHAGPGSRVKSAPRNI